MGYINALLCFSVLLTVCYGLSLPEALRRSDEITARVYGLKLSNETLSHEPGFEYENDQGVLIRVLLTNLPRNVTAQIARELCAIISNDPHPVNQSQQFWTYLHGMFTRDETQVVFGYYAAAILNSWVVAFSVNNAEYIVAWGVPT